LVVGGSEAVQLLRGQINTFPFNTQVDVAHEHIDTLIHESIEVPALVLSSESVAPPSVIVKGTLKQMLASRLLHLLNLGLMERGVLIK